jgi:N-methylhydantoinase A
MYFDGKSTQAKLYRRDLLTPGDTIQGPALIVEYTSATVLPPNGTASVDGFSNLVITIPEETGV